ncbi:hypothetical protein LNL84_19560 [Vibrio sp. ZSDZ34]|uniref:Uncharacterized protein n=1 Tax=Vibrio gelatinilyticus TaxID=2893468 RepID=A0A9X1WES2_9VIBR|nr:hypothetical protein [Vibrio gelatinilyticus]MCJ2378991.1 hypothetical protein [Vibrio gelatinilyticus]
MDIDELRRIVFKAREVFEQHHDHISKTFFGDFPNYSCGCSADLLAQYLISKGAKNLLYVYGENEIGSHGWLELDGLIIDITGDQFEDGVDSVYMSSNRDFHDQFSPLNKNNEPGVNGVLWDSYNKFKALMEPHA